MTIAQTPVFPTTSAMPGRIPAAVLVLCFYEPTGISTVPENVAFLQSCSIFSVSVVNLYEHGRNGGALSLSEHFNLESFDVVVLHNSISYNVDNLRSIDQFLDIPLKAFRGVKVLMKQDENYRFRELAAYIGDVGFDLILTCLPAEAIPLIYPPEQVGSARFLRMLTGYVTPSLRSIQAPDSERSIDIGYRGSIQPLSFGRLAYEKRQIGHEVERLLQGEGLRLDISSRWEDRFGGVAWLNFLAKCKATLGVESAASVFDLAGDLAARCEEIERRHGSFREDADYAELYLAELADLEGNIAYSQISPRHFEAAATRTLQIMYPGKYSGIFKAGLHYVELQRDASNIDQVLVILRDDNHRERIVRRAYDDIIANPEYWIETFVRRLDTHILRELRRKRAGPTRRLTLSRGKRNVLLLCAHRPALDPRLDWIAGGVPDGLCVTRMGVLQAEPRESLEESADSGFVMASSKRPPSTAELARMRRLVSKDEGGQAALAELLFWNQIVQTGDASIIEYFGSPVEGPRLQAFRWYLQHFRDVAATLLAQAETLRGFQAVIATDLDTLVPALILKAMYGVPVLYDAHEYWAASDVDAWEFERDYWLDLERRLVRHVNHAQTVSSGLARLLSSNTGLPFDVVANCEPRSARIEGEMAGPRRNDEAVRFLFQGNFAARRGLEELILAWPRMDPRAVLLLRGPMSVFRAEMLGLADKTGLLGSRILFPDPVSERELVAAITEADVGLIPYTPFGENYKNCCPNKMSQYMAAGRPILANHTSFVAEIMEQSGAGIVVDFNHTEELIAAVARFVHDESWRLGMAEAAASYFTGVFHWERVSHGMYERLLSFCAMRSGATLRIYRERTYGRLYRTERAVFRREDPVGGRLGRLLRPMWRRLPEPTRRVLKPYAVRVLRSSTSARRRLHGVLGKCLRMRGARPSSGRGV